MGEGYTYGFGAVDGDRFEDPLVGRLERFRRRFVGFGGPVPAYLAALQSDEQIHVGPIEWVELDEWYCGRVVLIGDAAHAGPPHMGEGGCMAMEDALVLADCLCQADVSSTHSRRTSEGEGLEPTGSRSKVGPRRRPGSYHRRSVTLRYASGEIRCFVTVIDRLFRRRSRFRIQTLW
jgi:hypothetical protein